MKQMTVNKEIKLKSIGLTDAEILFKTIDANREYLRKWLPFIDYVNRVEDEENFIKVLLTPNDVWGEDVFLIYYKGSFAGLISLKFNRLDRPNKKTEIGYWLTEAFQGKGIITECCRRLIEYAFKELDLNRVQIKIASGNRPSIRVVERLNLKFEGVERDGELLVNGFTDLNVYSVLKREW